MPLSNEEIGAMFAQTNASLTSIWKLLNQIQQGQVKIMAAQSQMNTALASVTEKVDTLSREHESKIAG